MVVLALTFHYSLDHNSFHTVCTCACLLSEKFAGRPNFPFKLIFLLYKMHSTITDNVDTVFTTYLPCLEAINKITCIFSPFLTMITLNLCLCVNTVLSSIMLFKPYIRSEISSNWCLLLLTTACNSYIFVDCNNFKLLHLTQAIHHKDHIVTFYNQNKMVCK